MSSVNKKDWGKLADRKKVEKVIDELKNNGIEAEYFENSFLLKKRLFELIPEKSEVLTMTSITLDNLKISEEINSSGKYNSVRNKLNSMDRAEQHSEMQKLGAAPEYVIGSIHAVTEDGKILIASNTGSQLPAYAYGSSKVIWIVGTQKIVKDFDEAIKRLYEYTLPLESERARKAYGVSGSFISKLLVINKEIAPGRITLLFLNEILGF